MAVRRFEPNVQRVLYYGDTPDHLAVCPQCGASLVADYQTFLVAARDQAKAVTPFLLGGSYGHFCPDCLTVVIDSERVRAALGAASRGIKFHEWILLALVDLDSWPSDKRHLPLSEVEDDLKRAYFTDTRRISRRDKPEASVSMSLEERRKRRARLKRERRKMKQTKRKK